MKFTKIWIVFVFLFLLSFTQNSFTLSTAYDLTISNDTIYGSLLLLLESESKVNYFNATIALPENTEIIFLKDSKGEINDYSFDGTNISFKTNTTIAKSSELVEIKFKTHNAVKKEFEALHYITLSLSALPESKTTITLRGKKFYSFEASLSFKGKITESELQLEGTGPTILSTTFSDSKAIETEHFAVFSEKDYSKEIKNAEAFFYLLQRITGIMLPYEKIPVIILEDERYNTIINDFSNGTYRYGFIIIRESEFEKNPEALLLHEAMHAFNAQIFTWNKTESVWFDEGTAKIIESLVLKLKGSETPNLFYPEKIIIENNKKYLYSPVSSITELLSYYKEGNDWIIYWKPEKENHEFGYAFAELIIKETIKNNGWKALLDAYAKFSEENKDINNTQELSQKISTTIKSNLKPCYSLNETELKECLQKINAFELNIPAARDLKRLNSLTEEIIKEERPSISMEKQEIINNAINVKNAIERQINILSDYFNQIVKIISITKSLWVKK